MRKRLAFILIITILINTIIPNYIYAGDADDAAEKISGGTSFEQAQEHQSETGSDTVTQVYDEGTAQVTPSDGSERTEELGETATSSNTVASVLATIIIALPWLVNNILTMLVNSVQTTTVEGNFLIQNVVFGKYELFDIDFMNFNSNSTKTMDELKKSVATWYYALRNIAIIASVIILIYIGIRMAISTTAEDKTKYKKMFVNWTTSFILIFIMHYIFIILIEIQSMILELLKPIASERGFENEIINDTWNSFQSAKGWGALEYAMIYFVFVYYQIKFFLAYFKRFLSVGFLLVISPLVTVSYSIDAAGDGKAQAFKAWLTNMVYNVFIQAIHATVYAIFIISADEIAKAVPIMGAILLMTLSRTEKIIKTTFKLSGKGIGDESLIDKIKGAK